MKYLNSLVFLGLLVMVSGCQKKEKVEPKKSGHHATSYHHKNEKPAAHKHEDKKGPKKPATKKPATKKPAVKKADHKKAAVVTQAAGRKAKGVSTQGYSHNQDEAQD